MRPTDQETTAGEKTVYYSSFEEGHTVPWGGGGAAWGSTCGPGGGGEGPVLPSLREGTGKAGEHM